MTARDGASGTTLLFQRNLQLLKGQAHANAGIALVEQYRLKRKSNKILHAMQQFDSAHQCVKALETLAQQDASDSIDVVLDKLKSKELEFLTCRWRGMLLWIKGDRQQAMRCLQDIASASMAVEEESDKEECVEAKLKILTESYPGGECLGRSKRFDDSAENDQDRGAV
jgi:hypothetical protein